MPSSPPDIQATLHDYLGSVRSAADHGAWYAALALALAIPDICSSAEHQGRSHRFYYYDWCRFFVEDAEPNLTDGDIYALRCAFLHLGSADLDTQWVYGQEAKIGKLYLTYSNGSSGLGATVRKTAVRPGERNLYALPVHELCNAILRGAERWLQSAKNDPETQKCLARLLTLYPKKFDLA